MNRRTLLQTMGASAAALAAGRAWAQMGPMRMGAPAVRKAHTLDASKLTPFVDALPLPERLKPVGRRDGSALCRVRAKAISAKMHRDLPLTRMWAYGAGVAPMLIEARSGEGVFVEWVNDLPARHILPVQGLMSNMGMEQAPETRMIPHLHGGRSPHESDGYPEEWFGPGKSKLDFYPNQQDAAALWPHDHAMGVSRLNVIAGLMGWYILRDAEEDALGLPSGEFEVPLMIYDRSFTPGGQLYYPNPPDEGAWAEEFLGDAMVVNGKMQPYFEVKPRKYRFRVLNSANSRFFAVALKNGQSFQVIGSDQGLLERPVEMRRLVLAPAERTDVVVDFSALAGQHVELVSDTLELMQFRVSAAAVKDESRVPAALRHVERIAEERSVRTRLMTLDEFDGDKGEPMVMLLNRKHWAEPVTEVMKLGTVEIWELANLTQDTHPIHLHMVRFQVLDRRAFSVDDYLSDEVVRYTGPVLAPAAHEMGWKDVVQCPAETVTRILVPFEPYAGRYLWHCHLLEHEANDMMRPYDVVA